MEAMRRSRCLARLAATLAVALAGVAAGGLTPAQARVTGIVIQSRVVASWGYNDFGELGDGTTTSRPQPGDIAVGNDVVQVSGGLAHALAVRSDGSVWAWGLNDHGELGDGTAITRSAPVQVAGLTGITQVAAGQEFSVALRSDGTVWAWGANDHGQLGAVPQTPVVTRPVNAMAAGSGIIRLTAGYDHVLALKADGTVLSWGDNESGELGRAITAPPGPASVAGLASVTQVSAGWHSSYTVHTVPFLVGL